MVLERLDHVEVGSLTLRETILAVKLELGGDDGVLAPTVHIEGGLGEHEGAGIGHIRSSDLGGGCVEAGVVASSPLRSSGESGNVTGTGHLEETPGGDEGVGAGCLGGSAEGVDGVGESIDGIGVVEGLGTECLVEGLSTGEGRAVVDVGIGLDNPDKLLARVVEVELDLVGRGSDRLISSELELLDEVLVGVLCHLATLVCVKEDIVDVEGGGHKGLLVSSRHGDGGGCCGKGVHGPEALTNGAEINVDLHLVILYESRLPSLSGYLSAFSFDQLITMRTFAGD